MIEVKKGNFFILNQEEIREKNSFLKKNFRLHQQQQLVTSEQAILFLKGALPNYNNLWAIISELHQLLLKYSELHFQTMPYMFQAVKQYLQDITSSTLYQNDMDHEISQQIVLENTLLFRIVEFELENLLGMMDRDTQFDK
ncbi:unnamed protein product (macronuclear) [Paramecium tetraurelia]|uniref:Uncharacterized protein n=1 Tax=Paramecium tetraurelia TaxID=5888 RepID=A0EF88_PARTE|nr:uncharacterized protein GSPATT00026302001 [Paramecium tetraurelia]CAK93979.1 unnamed protein product [Paramecium tetraurelia]|eukprot:XP_001461352.1 hypothetical protein (macronuclear) [Paramecium tetraurelia strain d4-2]